MVTSGPTQEAIDPVRYITNHSTGKMGYAIARVAAYRGADVTLVSGPVDLARPLFVETVPVESAREMFEAVTARSGEQDIIVKAAAVADYRVANAAEHKLKKDTGGIPPIELVENPDILAEVAKLPNGPWCVGFAAESHDLLQHASAKRLRKQVPLLVGNIGPATFGKDDNALLLIDDQGSKELPHASKDVLARQLVDEIAQRLSAKRP